MPRIEIKMTKKGESSAEATSSSWLKDGGDTVDDDENILEVATDKVDSEVPSPCNGVITEIRFQKDDVVAVGEVLALISPHTSDDELAKQTPEAGTPKIVQKPIQSDNKEVTASISVKHSSPLGRLGGDAFLSPLIISIAQKENLSLEEVQSIPGSGAEGRIQKSDIFNYLKNRKYPLQSKSLTVTSSAVEKSTDPKPVINLT